MNKNDSTINIDINDIDVQDVDTTGNSEALSDEQHEVADNNYAEEDIDEDDIAIADKNAPIIMLFGPRSSGKSMTLVRLSRYLRDNQYTIVVDDTFKSDRKYKEKCKKFLNDLNTTKALSGNAYTDFLLVKVVKHGRTICQFLEAPGEHYFDPEAIDASNFPPYTTEIIRNLRNRKIWAFITEAKWEVGHKTKVAYVDRIRNCKNMLMHSTDRCIILYNKIDQKKELFEDGQIHLGPAENEMRQEYEGLARVFKNNNPITSLWRTYNYKFVPFCTGYYFKDKGELKYKKSEDLYPKLLWDALMKCIRG